MIFSLVVVKTLWRMALIVFFFFLENANAYYLEFFVTPVGLYVAMSHFAFACGY